MFVWILLLAGCWLYSSASANCRPPASGNCRPSTNGTLLSVSATVTSGTSLSVTATVTLCPYSLDNQFYFVNTTYDGPWNKSADSNGPYDGFPFAWYEWACNQVNLTVANVTTDQLVPLANIAAECYPDLTVNDSIGAWLWSLDGILPTGCFIFDIAGYVVSLANCSLEGLTSLALCQRNVTRLVVKTTVTGTATTYTPVRTITEQVTVSLTETSVLTSVLTATQTTTATFTDCPPPPCHRHESDHGNHAGEYAPSPQASPAHFWHLWPKLSAEGQGNANAKKEDDQPKRDSRQLETQDKWVLCPDNVNEQLFLVNNTQPLGIGEGPEAYCEAVGMYLANVTYDVFPNLTTILQACNVTDDYVWLGSIYQLAPPWAILLLSSSIPGLNYIIGIPSSEPLEQDLEPYVHWALCQPYPAQYSTSQIQPNYTTTITDYQVTYVTTVTLRTTVLEVLRSTTTTSTSSTTYAATISVTTATETIPCPCPPPSCTDCRRP